MTDTNTDPGGIEPDPDLVHHLAAHTAPAACADALIRDAQGQVLIVDPVYKPGWDLPGGMLGDEEPAEALVRELREELGLPAEVGRLLVVDTVPARRWGRTILALIYAAHPGNAIEVADLVLQSSEIREARFVSDQEALALLAEPVAARLAAALAAERGSHTAVLRDGRPVPVARRDHYRLLPAPMMAATVLVRDTAGRVLVLDPSYKAHLELPGGMVEAHETPAQAAGRELAEELALTVQVGRLLVVDSNPADRSRHGRALTCHVYDTEPLTPAQAQALRFTDGEILAARWLEPKEAQEQLPAVLAQRVEAALRALRGGTVVEISRGVGHGPSGGV
ncbi:NUDIX hydrolase [Kitasatospora kifunensis]|uniref:ADP-ribose pyrophosphatase YjhB (NUDIX family) n=1 Tax=Kitasatospora kifunensis TaxID=58351 RepID=A0A7W7RAZ9_KITKI|nr:NUDIX hydrolase [Kitasatospora kifunensis]MBB4928638.1 ADP-ribose pyrophosphatase YjhB (NUDIX family) [Kitasatospora kifunensis]